MWMSDNKKLARIIIRSMRERPQDWYAGEYRIYHPDLGIMVRHWSISACSITVIHDGDELIESFYSWPYVPWWRLMLRKECYRLCRIRSYHGYVGTGDRREWIT